MTRDAKEQGAAGIPIYQDGKFLAEEGMERLYSRVS